MEAPAWYFEQDTQPDQEFIHINDHLLALGDIENDVEQLVAELYDECEQTDPDIIHAIITDICKKLDMQLPNRDDLKL